MCTVYRYILHLYFNVISIQNVVSKLLKMANIAFFSYYETAKDIILLPFLRKQSFESNPCLFALNVGEL